MRLPQWLLLTAFIAAIVLLWSLLELLLLLIFAAVVLAMALCTLVGILRERRPMQRPLALLLCIIGLLLLVTGAAGFVVPPFLEEFALLLQKLPEAGQTLVRLGLGWIDSISEAIYGADAFPDLDQLGLNGPLQLVPDSSSLAAGVGSGFLGLLGLAGNLGNGVLRLLFVVAVALMIVIQPQAYRNVGLQLIPSFYRRRGRRILDPVSYTHLTLPTKA